MADAAFVTIAKYREPMQGEMARELLESSGIRAHVRDNNTVSIMPWYALAVGYVRVDVAAEDVERARTILAEYLIDLEAQPSDNAEKPDYSELAEAAYAEMEADSASHTPPPPAPRLATCAACGGAVPVPPLGFWQSVAFSLWTFVRQPIRCTACGHEDRVRLDPPTEN